MVSCWLIELMIVVLIVLNESIDWLINFRNNGKNNSELVYILRDLNFNCI